MLIYKVNNYIKLVLKQGGFDEYLTQLIYEFMKYQEEYENITNYLNLLKKNEIKLQFEHKYKYGLIRYSSKLNYYILYNNNNLISEILNIVNKFNISCLFINIHLKDCYETNHHILIYNFLQLLNHLKIKLQFTYINYFNYHIFEDERNIFRYLINKQILIKSIINMKENLSVIEIIYLRATKEILISYKY